MMNRWELIAIATAVATSCIDPDHPGVEARISPNGPDLDAAITKCVELGFAPDHGTLLGSCVRAMRADYCGDGTAHTVLGFEVNVFDVGGAVPDDSSWPPEAEWTDRGAACISNIEHTRAWRVSRRAPMCHPTLIISASCGTGAFGDVVTELRPSSP